MTSKLAQKHPIKGTREFQIVDDEIEYSIQSPFKNDSLSVLFQVLEPEPVISGSMLSFISIVNKEPLVELFLNKPNKEEFDDFVEKVHQKIIEHSFGRFRVDDQGVDVDVTRLSESIEMLEKYVDPSEIESLLSALVELKSTPEDVKCQTKVADIFNELGFVKTQVITYAPYINFLFFGQR